MSGLLSTTIVLYILCFRSIIFFHYINNILYIINTSSFLHLITMTPPINLTGIHTPYSPSFINSLNDTALNYVRSQCNTHVCLLSYAQVRYDPSLGGNMFFLLLFAAILVIQVGLGVWHKTWTYLVAMFMGLLLEVIGYHARVQMSHNPWLSNPFLMYVFWL